VQERKGMNEVTCQRGKGVAKAEGGNDERKEGKRRFPFPEQSDARKGKGGEGWGTCTERALNMEGNVAEYAKGEEMSSKHQRKYEEKDI
jgi:hypothetical protein